MAMLQLKKIIILPLLLTTYSIFPSQPPAINPSVAPMIVALGVAFAACGLTAVHYFDNYCTYGQFVPTEKQKASLLEKRCADRLNLGCNALLLISAIEHDAGFLKAVNNVKAAHNTMLHEAVMADNIALKNHFSKRDEIKIIHSSEELSY